MHKPMLIMGSGSEDRMPDWESGGLGSSLSSATDLLGDIGQVASALCASILSLSVTLSVLSVSTLSSLGHGLFYYVSVQCLRETV